ncbi:MAG: hypothetical protein VX733_09585 [Candidatus Latescibacterota bacterium]|nr:hypothetical protein [Candidatus Latescibacterota bacterium]
MFPHLIRFRSRPALALALPLLLLIACDDDSGSKLVSSSSKGSTWARVQQILTDNCTSCHAAGTSQAHQSNLLLTPDVAYSQLIDVPSTNLAAQETGLVRLGSQGIVSLSKSFLWEKINAPSEYHFYNDHPNYGTLMPPPPSVPLTFGELEFIRQWIIAGAPEDGEVADPTLLDNEERYLYNTDVFAPLTPPAYGIQLHLGPFEVFPNNERELFYFERLNNPAPIFIDAIEIVMRRGSHHFIIYGFEEDVPADVMPEEGVIRDLRDRHGVPQPENFLPILFQEFIFGTQWPSMQYEMPESVALRIPANYAIDMNSHYVNRTDESFEGEVYVNLHYADPDEIEHVAQIIDFNNFDIDLPPGKVTTLKRDFTFDQRVNIFQLFSHAHELNTEFRVEILGGDRDGEEVYFSSDWEHPPILTYDPALVIKHGEGFRLIATYDNFRDYTVNFGLLSTDEMMILFGLYYLE